MIVITGAAGFIASCLITKLNQEGFNDLILVDDFSKTGRQNNYQNKRYTGLVERDVFPTWLAENQNQVQFVFHLGARTDTTEFDRALLNALNFEYSKKVWNVCADHGIPLVYASSAATYGLGEYGYDDDHKWPEHLKPLNPYGDSKNDFDIWVLNQKRRPSFWAGLKFFNVYGPNEYHKGRMASVIWHAYNQITSSGAMKLFRSHHPDFQDGEQLRDFVYVKDVVEVCYFFMNHRKDSGIYNLGTGKARSFNDLVRAVFKALNKEAQISYIDTPQDIRDKYQYFTEAKMDKLYSAGYPHSFTSLEDGVTDYVSNYLVNNRYF